VTFLSSLKITEDLSFARRPGRPVMTPHLNTFPSPSQLRKPLHFANLKEEFEALRGTNLYGATVMDRVGPWEQCRADSDVSAG
jgi:hypothetical protein